MIEWTDVHTHLNMLDDSVEKVVKEARSQGVNHLITIGTESKDWPFVIQFAKDFKSVKGTLGMHPHSASQYNDEVELILSKGLDEEGIVACGEIGLDYYYEYSDRKKQKEVFLKQMNLASEKQLPVEIHTRSAEVDTISVLNEFKGRVKGLLHCFTGTWNLAKEALDRGFNISFSGILTFKKADDLREVCQKVPLDRLHLETDAPYLAPAPNRGKQNRPAWLIHTAQMVANLHNISLQELSIKTQNNRDLLFGKIFQ